jgi:hypothetical protein
MEFKEIPTPLGVLDIQIHCYPKELNEEKYYNRYDREPMQDNYYAYIVTRRNTNGYGQESNAQSVIINGIAYTFSLGIKKLGSEDWRYEYLSIDRLDRSSVTNGAREKVYKLRDWFKEWIKDKNHILYEARNEALKSGEAKLRAEAEEKVKEAEALCEKANEIWGLIV